MYVFFTQVKQFEYRKSKSKISLYVVISRKMEIIVIKFAHFSCFLRIFHVH